MSDMEECNPNTTRQPLNFQNAGSTLKYGDCSPMLTHLHTTRSPHHQDLSPQHRTVTRSMSFGSVADVFVEPFVPRTQSSPVLKDSQQTQKASLPQNRLLQMPQSHQNDEATPFFIAVLYGLINAIIVLPVLMSFGSIIYRDDAFAPFMPVLVKLTVVSGMVHQLCFSAFSGLPFAVGQVQDAGLIFLSTMAKSLVEYCQSHSPQDDQVLLATVTVGLSLSTALLGLGLVVIGKLRLAQYVQLLPTPVIGGYLAYIGFFCGFSGLALMASGGGSSLSIQILLDHFVFVMPGILGGIMIYVLVRQLRHMLVLPLCIVFLVSAFYLGLMVTNTTIADATEIGWIRPSDPPPVWFATWDYLRLDKVAWDAFPSQALTLLSMIFVVALSSSLDVAAIELELNKPLNYNSELMMVGLSNFVSGLTGGYTGSYIFSQTIFSLRAGITSRTAGFVLALCEGVILVLPIPILAYLPNFFFGSLLVMISVDLMYEWLWEVQHNLTKSEYAVCLATFVLIQLTGVEYGIILGVLLHIVLSKLEIGLEMKTSDSDPVASLKSVHPPSSYGAMDNTLL